MHKIEEMDNLKMLDVSGVINCIITDCGDESLREHL